MKKILMSLSLLMLVPAVFILTGCFGITDGAFSVRGVKLDSLSTVMGETQTVERAGSGAHDLNGRYQYRLYTFENNTDRDAARSAYVLYLQQQEYPLGPIGAGIQLLDGTIIGLSWMKPVGTNYAFVGIDDKTENKLWIVLDVRTS